MEETWKEFEEWVTAHGGRHTSERRAVFEAMLAMPQLFTVEDLWQQMNNGTAEGGLCISRPTLYNTLDAFMQSGLLTRLHVNGSNMYLRIEGQKTVVVQVCTSCGSVLKLKEGGVAEALGHLAYRRFTPQRSISVVYGHCSKCDTKTKKDKTRYKK